MAAVIAHIGGAVDSSITLEQYSDKYKMIYEGCFREMRTSLGLHPVNTCDSREELLKKKNDIFISAENDKLIGSITIYENELDDLIIEKDYQRNGYGKLLLKFAISHMQKKQDAAIVLHVADWNKNAINLYLKSGFKITKTETISM